MIRKTLLLAISLAAVAVLAYAQDKKAAPTKITGYLIDNMCVEAAQGGEAEEAEGHMVSCALMEACVKSGYSIISEGKAYKLDERGNKLALKLLRDTRVRQGLSVAVAGTLDGDTLRAETLVEAR
jgi:hypothetical protein